MITANEEVQTFEKAQAFVHDLHLFVIVQILDDTLAVLSSTSSAKNLVILTIGHVSKSTSDQEWEKDSVQDG